ncbi:CPBP family intramembrane glutamic endopeptidase [Serpentinicella alkaliphila]|uniref:CAAX prenyl protease 2/Lysostaphin resistance protein A-like domain-containing protein n=1 Tax=Serpentinicella alkaliphila TaxID=1734049 RepID=A0A4R2U2B1_9FIRM|nr:type II CAAX endopeptidase family protein [Serpentinicella alkaliphila]QUH24410.1 CPBP family intramembrane metalloprotease [Serpentinicella alkaliphila]TCQ04199.1 hypothetical protein EDD79_100783 [Serpentinicella alkaliphila]
MNKGFKSVLVVLGYLMIYFSADLFVGLFLGLIMMTLYPVYMSGEITYDIILKNVNEFFYNNINIFIILSALMALLIYWLIFKIRKINFIEYINFSKLSRKDKVVCSLLGMAISIFLSSLLMITSIHEFFPNHSKTIDSVTKQQPFLLIIFSIGIIVPVFEEILFRGLIFNNLKHDLNIYFAIFAQALIFGFVHGNTLQMVYTFFGGIILALSYIWIRSIWAPVLIHIFWNSTSVILGFINVGGQISYIVLFTISTLTIILTTRNLWTNRKKGEENFIESDVEPA